MADFVGALTKLSEVLMPSGTMLPFAGKSVPDGWLLCNGAAVSRTTYADLFAAIGTAWGTGDGSTTFNLPNCDSRFMEGTTDASKVGTYREAGLPNITGGGHGYYWSDLSVTGFDDVWGAIKKTGGERQTQISASSGYGDGVMYWEINANQSSNIYGSSNSVQPASCQTLIIIKV